jgi:hypothetical protein
MSGQLWMNAISKMLGNEINLKSKIKTDRWITSFALVFSCSHDEAISDVVVEIK